MALDRWKTAWDICTAPTAPEDLDHTGFMKDAAIELQYLAQAIVEQSPVKHATRRT
jgi:hypothetical protein